MQEIREVSEAAVLGKRVLLRTSLNVPLASDGTPSDMFRLQAALPTIQWLSQQGARTIILAHLGRSGQSLGPVVKALSGLLPGISLDFFDGPLTAASEAIAKLQNGACLVLENVRREAGEETNDPNLAKRFADLGDLYVDDAFADAHRAHASIVGIPALLPSYAGLLLMKEITHLAQALTPPPGALALIGGAKFETKEPLLTKLIGIYQHMLLGGALANDVLKARGMPVGNSVTSATPVPVSLAGQEQIRVPIDAVMRSQSTKASREGYVTDVRVDEQIVDVGSVTLAAWGASLAAASFVLWNGPVGIYEDGFMTGTDTLAQALVRGKVPAVVGGGDTLSALQKEPFDPKLVFLSTGGGAMLEYLTDGTLPGIEALKTSPR